MEKSRLEEKSAFPKRAPTVEPRARAAQTARLPQAVFQRRWKERHGGGAVPARGFVTGGYFREELKE